MCTSVNANVMSIWTAWEWMIIMSWITFLTMLRTFSHIVLLRNVWKWKRCSFNRISFFASIFRTFFLPSSCPCCTLNFGFEIVSISLIHGTRDNPSIEICLDFPTNANLALGNALIIIFRSGKLISSSCLNMSPNEFQLSPSKHFNGVFDVECKNCLCAKRSFLLNVRFNWEFHEKCQPTNVFSVGSIHQ